MKRPPLRPPLKTSIVMCALLVLPGTSRAQQLTGSVEGTLRDTSGRVVPGVSLVLKNVATGMTLSQVSNSVGDYAFNSVKPGSYNLRASLQGFKTLTQLIEVDLNKTVKLDLTLSVGDLTEEVTVTADSATLDVTHSEVATSVNSTVITDLPTVTRDITSLVELLPGARQVLGVTAGGSQVVDLSGNYALGDGTRRSQSVFYLDGSENMGAWRNQALQMPNPDTIQEVQIVASSASAEFGKQPGISMNAITKSGTNVFHGTAFIAFHATGLNANTWSANFNGKDRPEDRQKWMGGTLGGPIKKGRTFFFFSYQHFYDNDPSEQSGTRMPTQAMLKGDFSAIPNFNIPALDPTTNKAIGKVIPSYLLNPIALKMAARFPTIPEYSNDPVKGRFFWQFQRPAHNNEWLGKIDHQINARNQIAFTYLTTKGAQIHPENVSGLTNNVPGWGGDTETGARQNTASVRHVWTPTSTLVIENRAALGRLYSTRDRTGEEENIATLGGIWNDVSPGIVKTLPSIFLSGGPTARGGQFSDIVQQNYRILNTTSWLHGKHNFKFGAELQKLNYSRVLNFDNGQVRFTGAYANNSRSIAGPWPTLTNPSGDNQFALAWADFLMGKVNSFQATGKVDTAFNGLASFFFAQDQFKLSKGVTITPGLRYELYGTQSSSNSVLAGYVAGHQSSQYPNAPLGLAFEGDPGIPDGLREKDYNNFAPRLGIAWDVFGDAKTVIRVGGGLYYAYPPLSIVEQLASIVGSPTLSGANASLTDPWGTSHVNSGDTVLQYPNGMPSFDPDPAKRVFVPTDLVGFSPNVTTPRQVQFNVALQREIIQGVSIEATYVGNRATHGWSVRDNNLAVWAANASTGNVNARRPNQTWRAIDLISTDVRDTYDAFQLVANVNRKGFYGRLSYNLQRYLTTAGTEGQEVGIDNTPGAWATNPRNINADLASVVPRQQVHGTFNYYLPTPKFAHSGFLKHAFGGWELSDIFTWYDGDPLNVTLGSDFNVDGFSGDRPNQVGPIIYPRTVSGSVITWIDRTAFANPPTPTADNPYPFGNLPRNAVRGPHRLFMSAALLKTFTIKERYRVQWRLDTANILNHPNTSNPNTTLSSSQFGTIQTKDGGGRVFQMQLKFIF